MSDCVLYRVFNRVFNRACRSVYNRALMLCLFGLVATQPALAQLATPNASTAGANFSLGLTKDNGTSYVTAATTTDAVKILATIKPLASQLGQGSIYFVATTGAVTYMRNVNGGFVPWTFGSVPTLVPWKQTTLTATTAVDLLEGLDQIPLASTFAIYIGYKGADGALVYTLTPLSITITTPVPTKTPLQQAQDYYSANISSIVQLSPACISCHISTGVANITSLILHPTSSSDNVSWNVDQFTNLVKSRGRQYILNTTLGQNDHNQQIFPQSGGQLFLTTDQRYKNLDTFLQMLEQL
ncbi:MAG TPA: hypothetical protein VMH83_14765 [Candidatus Acidoferrum sp.]|nr:hypothetical protein [Candidatus Acidoferrum sp.]